MKKPEVADLDKFTVLKTFNLPKKKPLIPSGTTCYKIKFFTT